jgi:hypothetical protein
VNARAVAVLAMVLLVLRALSARVTLLPGLSVPVLVPFGAVVLAVVLLGAWLIYRRAARFRSCPHPHPAW